MFTEEDQQKLDSLCRDNPELNSLISNLQEDNKLMISKISHEIRNPLTLIYSTLQLMESSTPNITELKYWKQIIYDTKDLVYLLEELSSFNSCDMLNLTSIDLCALINDLKNSYLPKANKQNISLNVVANEIVEKNISNYICDPMKLRRVFTNIIENALNAFDSVNTNGTIVISLDMNNSLYYKGYLDSYVAISIRNNAKPIPKDEIETIFKPFITYKPNGSGLGLALSSKIINSHGGSIQVTSDEDYTEFIVFLPLGNK